MACKNAINIQSTDTPAPHYLSCISAPVGDFLKGYRQWMYDGLFLFLINAWL
jgi:hypothetical protein